MIYNEIQVFQIIILKKFKKSFYFQEAITMGMVSTHIIYSHY